MGRTIKSSPMGAIGRAILWPLIRLERARGRRRLALLALYLLIIGLLGILAWRHARLVEVPAIADPFDSRPLLTLRVPDRRNAFPLYRRATAQLVRDRAIELRIFNSPYAWPAADPEALAYLEANEAAFDLWLAATARPDSLPSPPGQLQIEADSTVLGDLRIFYWHAMVRASRLEAAGKMALSWELQRAVLRCGRHAARNSGMLGRMIGASLESSMRTKLANWAGDPRVDTALLRRALADFRELDVLTPPVAESLQFGFLEMEQILDDPEAIRRLLVDDPWDVGEVDKIDWRNHLSIWRYWLTFLRHEPERTRRVMRLAFANWLAHVGDPPTTRPPLVGTTTTPRLVFDAPTPGAPGLDPRKLASWIEESPLAETLSWTNFESLLGTLDRDRRERAAIAKILETEIMGRECQKPATLPEF